jgi:FkbM family methyltransferase
MSFARSLGRPVKVPARAMVRRWAADSGARAAMNRLYNHLNLRQQAFLFDAFARVFAADETARAEAGEWAVRFAGRPIRFPLRPDHMGLDWDRALGTAGYDSEIKKTYAAILRSPKPPHLFVDIGGNFGTDSLIFLSHGVRTITFEPNPSCHAYFAQACALNGFRPRLETAALGETPGAVDLVFPEGETWLGTTDAAEAVRLGEAGRPVSTTVQRRALDDYLPAFRGARRILIRIDTGGSEYAVLRGARRTLALGPLILLEMRPDPARRDEVLDLLAEAGYRMARLPWRPGRRRSPPSRDEILESPETNFLAVPLSRPPALSLAGAQVPEHVPAG